MFRNDQTVDIGKSTLIIYMVGINREMSLGIMVVDEATILYVLQRTNSFVGYLGGTDTSHRLQVHK
uniref:Uncharacterized protein n=1 Tax=Arundo donax TaxID=35708 RepID=A0A0A9ESQ8_ARUDO